MYRVGSLWALLCVLLRCKVVMEGKGRTVFGITAFPTLHFYTFFFVFPKM